ncbi:MAG TPA: hypothetical protein VEW68_06095 [Patescibacteria group bacterium]|nr:hypothetical protein [Patescibacteria group bacterium]
MTKTWGGEGVELGAALGVGEAVSAGDGDGLGLGVATEARVPQAAATRIAQAAAASMRPVVSIAGGRWGLDARPERGGRVVSLRLDGEELLDQGIGVDQPTADGFVEGGAFGWDEMVPTLDATASLPDHGEAWRLPWVVERAEGAEAVMTCSGRVAPWELERRVQLGDAVTASYTYRNAGGRAREAYWCAHPLFKFEPGMEIDAAGGVSEPPPGESAKVHLPAGRIDRVRLRWSSGRGIEMSWDPRLTPYVGIWICNGDLGGYHQVGVEPATGGGDRPDSAMPAPLLMPGETLRWWLRINPI